MQTTRDFALCDSGVWTFCYGIRWPQPRESFDCASQWYNRSFALACPECALVWCRSQVHNPPTEAIGFVPTWCLRERYCASCMQSFYGRESYANPYDAWHPTYCPGTILSVSRHEQLETPSSILWYEQLASLPRDWRYRELRLWAQLDLLCNPPPPKEPAPDDRNSDPLVTFLNEPPPGCSAGL